MGVPIFNRTTRHVELTDYGLYALPFFKKIVSTEDEYLRGIADMKALHDRTLYIGMISQIPAEIADLITAYSESNPDIRFRTCTGESEDLRKELMGGNLDFIFIRESPDDSGDPNRIRLIPSPLNIIMSKSHRLAAKTQIHIEELKNEAFILSEDSALAYRLAVATAKESGFEPDVVFQGSKSQILGLVRRNIGISVLFSDLSDVIYDDLVAVKLLPAQTADINCVFNPEYSKEKKHSDFISFIMSSTSG